MYAFNDSFNSSGKTTTVKVSKILSNIGKEAAKKLQKEQRMTITIFKGYLIATEIGFVFVSVSICVYFDIVSMDELRLGAVSIRFPRRKAQKMNNAIAMGVDRQQKLGGGPIDRDKDHNKFTTFIILARIAFDKLNFIYHLQT